jgi:hypothetical protein
VQQETVQQDGIAKTKLDELLEKYTISYDNGKPYEKGHNIFHNDGVTKVSFQKVVEQLGAGYSLEEVANFLDDFEVMAPNGLLLRLVVKEKEV